MPKDAENITSAVAADNHFTNRIPLEALHGSCPPSSARFLHDWHDPSAGSLDELDVGGVDVAAQVGVVHQRGQLAGQRLGQQTWSGQTRSAGLERTDPVSRPAAGQTRSQPH